MVGQQEVLRVLNRAGWHFGRTEDHHVLKRADGTGRVIVPLHREIKPGTFRGIFKLAGITLEECDTLRRE